jgi:hypothetical protein
MSIRPMPPLGLLEKHFRYNPYTGELKNWNSGNIAKRLDSKGKYIQVDFQDKVWQAHRICYYLGTQRDPEGWQIDHEDRVYTNNRLDNLRLLDNADQQQNTKRRSCNRSGIKGVCWDKKGSKWVSYITINKQKLRLYYGNSFDDAVKKRREAEKEYYPNMY